MGLPATDAFTAANGTALTTYSANWSNNTTNGFQIQSNNVCCDNGGGGEKGAHWNADTFDNAQYAQGVITAMNSLDTPGIGICVRASALPDVATFYGYYSSGGGAGGGRFLFKMVTGTWTQLGSTNSTAFAVGNVVRLEVKGTTLAPSVNGVTDPVIGNQTDSAIASGSPGLSGFNNDGSAVDRLDNWEGGNLVSDRKSYAEFPKQKVAESLLTSAV